MKSFHGPVLGQVSLNTESDQRIDNERIHLNDINGRTLAVEQGVNLSQGTNQITLQTQDLTLGTYVVVVESDLGSRSIKVSVR